MLFLFGSESLLLLRCIFFFSSRRRHTILQGDWSSDVCSSDLETLPARVVAIEAALEVAGDRREAPFASGPHSDRVELQRRHAVVVHQLPKLWQMLHQGRDDLLGRADIG